MIWLWGVCDLAAFLQGFERNPYALRTWGWRASQRLHPEGDPASLEAKSWAVRRPESDCIEDQIQDVERSRFKPQSGPGSDPVRKRIRA